MTARQFRKLETIIAKLEALEAEVSAADAERLRTAKNELLRACR